MGPWSRATVFWRLWFSGGYEASANILGIYMIIHWSAPKRRYSSTNPIHKSTSPAFIISQEPLLQMPSALTPLQATISWKVNILHKFFVCSWTQAGDFTWCHWQLLLSKFPGLREAVFKDFSIIGFLCSLKMRSLYPFANLICTLSNLQTLAVLEMHFKNIWKRTLVLMTPCSCCQRQDFISKLICMLSIILCNYIICTRTYMIAYHTHKMFSLSFVGHLGSFQSPLLSLVP